MPISDDSKPSFFVEKKTRRSMLYYWQPSASMRKQGHRLRALGDDREAALEKCKQINAQIEREKSLPDSRIKHGPSRG